MKYCFRDFVIRGLLANGYDYCNLYGDVLAYCGVAPDGSRFAVALAIIYLGLF